MEAKFSWSFLPGALVLMVGCLVLLGSPSSAAAAPATEASSSSEAVTSAYWTPHRLSGERACGRFATWTEGVRVRSKFFAKGVRCRKARRILRKLNGARGPRGWHCTGSGEGGYCFRGRYRSFPAARRGKYVRHSLVIRRAGTTPVISAGTGVETRARFRRCRDVVYRLSNGTVYTRTRGLKAKSTSCRKARKVARAFLTKTEGVAVPPKRFSGFRCSYRSNGSGINCRKSFRRVVWSFSRR